MMQEIHDEHPQNGNYGAPRMQQALMQRGMKAGLRRVKRIMREHGWLHERRRRPKGLTKADPAAMASENLLKQDFHANRPFAKLPDGHHPGAMQGRQAVHLPDHGLL